MTLSRGDYSINIERINGFGKNKGLWIGKGNQMVKVASFGSDKKADAFEGWIKYLLFGPFDDPEDNEMPLP